MQQYLLDIISTFSPDVTYISRNKPMSVRVWLLWSLHCVVRQ